MSIDELKSTFYPFRGREGLVALFAIARQVLETELRLYNLAVQEGEVKEIRAHSAAISQLLPSLIKLGLALMSIGDFSEQDLVSLLSKVPGKQVKEALKVLKVKREK